MEEFLIREIKEQSEEYPNIIARRTRTSAGFAQISITYGTQTIKFSNDSGNDAYETQALETAKLLDEIALEPCVLPEVKKGQ